MRTVVVIYHRPFPTHSSRSAQLGPYIFRRGVYTKKNMLKLVSTTISYTMNGVQGKIVMTEVVVVVQDERMAQEGNVDGAHEIVSHKTVCVCVCVLLFVTFM